jgi:WD40 repeat protein
MEVDDCSSFEFECDVSESIEVLDKLISKYDSIVNHPINHVEQYVDDIKNKIDIDREMLILKINKLSQKMIEKLDEFSENCKSNIPNLNNLLKKANQELMELKLDINQIKNDCQQFSKKKNAINVDKLVEKCSQTIFNIESKANDLENDLFNAGRCIFVPNDQYKNDDRVLGELIIRNNKISKKIKCYDLVEVNEYVDPEDDLYDSFTSNDSRSESSRVACIDILGSNILYAGFTDGFVKVFDIEQSKMLYKFKTHYEWINLILVLPNYRLLTGSDDKDTKVWDLRTLEIIKYLDQKFVFDAFLSQKGILFTAHPQNITKIWNVSTLEQITTKKFCNEFLETVQCIKEDSKGKLFVCKTTGTVSVHNQEDFEMEFSFTLGHKNEITGIELISDNFIVSCSKDKTIKFWSTFSGICCHKIKNNLHSIPDIFKFLNHDTFITSDFFNNTCFERPKKKIMQKKNDFVKIRIWNKKAGKCIKSFDAHSDHILNSIEMPNGNLITISVDNMIKVWKIFE